MFARFRTPIYKNTGSVARDHLAAERTYLAWLRTGLGFVALGIAVERFAQLDISALLQPLTPRVGAATAIPDDEHRSSSLKSADLLAGALLGTGGGSIVYGTTRYFATMRLLEQGLYRPAYYGAGALGLAVGSIAGGIYWTAVKERRPPP